VAAAKDHVASVVAARDHDGGQPLLRHGEELVRVHRRPDRVDRHRGVREVDRAAERLDVAEHGRRERVASDQRSNATDLKTVDGGPVEL